MKKNFIKCIVIVFMVCNILVFNIKNIEAFNVNNSNENIDSYDGNSLKLMTNPSSIQIF